MTPLRRTIAATTMLIAVVTLPVDAQQAAGTGVHPISGRSYARVMGYQGAEWLDREERDIEEAPDIALDALELKKGDTVADIGAGSGYMTVRMAERVGPTGHVWAED